MHYSPTQDGLVYGNALLKVETDNLRSSQLAVSFSSLSSHFLRKDDNCSRSAWVAMAPRRVCNNEMVCRDLVSRSRNEADISLSSWSGYIVDMAVSNAATVPADASTRSRYVGSASDVARQGKNRGTDA